MVHAVPLPDILLPGMEFVLAETPLIHPETGALWWVDIPPGRLFCLPVGAEDPLTFDLGTRTGSFAFTPGGRILAATEGKGVCMLDPPRETALPVWRPEFPEPGCFNDGRVDPQGRWWLGWLTHARIRPGCLFRCGPAGPVRIIDDLMASNGIGFSPDGRIAYVTDSGHNHIRIYRNHDGEAPPTLAGLLIEQPREMGIFDGLTVDADGKIWTVLYRGAAILCLDPFGRELHRLPMPVGQVTHAVFDAAGGMVVTTGHRDMSAEARAREPLAGHLLSVPARARGQHEHLFLHLDAMMTAPANPEGT